MFFLAVNLFLFHQEKYSTKTAYYFLFGNLTLIMLDLFKVNFKGGEIKSVEITIAKYLPVYAAWTAFVVFVIPLIFGLK